MKDDYRNYKPLQNKAEELFQCTAELHSILKQEVN